MSYHKPNQQENVSFGGTVTQSDQYNSTNLVVIICDMLYLSLHQILYERNIYPAQIFSPHKIYNISVRTCIHDQLKQYTQQLINQIRLNLLKVNQLIKIVFVIYCDVKTHSDNNDGSVAPLPSHQRIVLERYVYDIKYDSPSKNESMQLNTAQYNQLTIQLAHLYLTYKNLTGMLNTVEQNPRAGKCTPQFKCLVYTNQQHTMNPNNTADISTIWSSLTQHERNVYDDGTSDEFTTSIHPLKAIRLNYLYLDVYIERYHYK